jgi:hypothetical protein
MSGDRPMMAICKLPLLLLLLLTTRFFFSDNYYRFYLSDMGDKTMSGVPDMTKSARRREARRQQQQQHGVPSMTKSARRREARRQQREKDMDIKEEKDMENMPITETG